MNHIEYHQSHHNSPLDQWDRRYETLPVIEHQTDEELACLATFLVFLDRDTGTKYHDNPESFDYVQSDYTQQKIFVHLPTHPAMLMRIINTAYEYGLVDYKVTSIDRLEEINQGYHMILTRFKDAGFSYNYKSNIWSQSYDWFNRYTNSHPQK